MKSVNPLKCAIAGFLGYAFISMTEKKVLFFLKQTRLTATCYHDIVYNSDNGSEHNESFSFSWYVVVL